MQYKNKIILIKYLIILVALLATEYTFCQTVKLDSSNLPICIIDTRGKTIANEPRIQAHMKIIYNDRGKMNYTNSKITNYNNFINIEIRGNSSQAYPQKQYGLELRDSTTGNDIDTSIMGLPKEEDFVLYAPYNDISFLRNVLTYHLWNQMGHWGPRTRFCEVILNGQYQGIYVLTESIKRDPNRVDIANLKTTDNSGIELTGGYIMKIDKVNGTTDRSFVSKVKSTSGQNINWGYHYPEGTVITSAQENYIHQYIDNLELLIASNNFADPVNGYRKFISTPSFIDYFIITEFTRNTDGYKASSFFYKEKAELDGSKGQFKAGPLWDYNFGYGNASFCSGAQTNGWMYDGCTPATLPTPTLWRRLLADPEYLNEVKCRYTQLRKTILDTAYLYKFLNSYALDTLAKAQVRHFTKWKVLGTNPGGFNAYIVNSYPEELVRIRTWIKNRLLWMDANLQGVCAATTTKLKAPLNPFCNQNAAPALTANQPFGGAPFFYNGKEKIKLPNTSIARWVLVEIRSDKDSTKIIDRRAALIKMDSTVVDTNLQANIVFPNATPNENYFIVLRYDAVNFIISKNDIKLPSQAVLNLNSATNRRITDKTSELIYNFRLEDKDTFIICQHSDLTVSFTNLINIGYDKLKTTVASPSNLPYKINANQSVTFTAKEDGYFMVTIYNECDANYFTRHTFIIHVKAFTLPKIEGPDKICPNGFAIWKVQNLYNNYEWSNGDKTNEIKLTIDNLYTISVTDINGCMASDSKTLTVLPEIEGQIEKIINLSNCKFTFVPKQSNASYTYLWSNGSTKDTSSSQDKVINLIVTDQYGCIKSYTASCNPTYNKDIPNQTTSFQLNAYPNPSTGSLMVDALYPIQDLKIYNSLGRMITNYKIEKINDRSCKINNLEPGFYYIEAIDLSNEKQSTSILIIPNK